MVDGKHPALNALVELCRKAVLDDPGSLDGFCSMFAERYGNDLNRLTEAIESELQQGKRNT